MEGWMDGWVEGSQSRVKDCLQQSKMTFISKIDPPLKFYLNAIRNLNFKNQTIFGLFI